MKKMKNLFLIKLIFLLTLISGCETIQKKSDEIVKKENKKLSQFIGQPISELKTVMGKPNSEVKSETGSKILIYTTKKYGIPCERKFEVNSSAIIVGFSSSGCI